MSGRLGSYVHVEETEEWKRSEREDIALPVAAVSHLFLSPNQRIVWRDTKGFEAPDPGDVLHQLDEMVSSRSRQIKSLEEWEVPAVSQEDLITVEEDLPRDAEWSERHTRVLGSIGDKLCDAQGILVWLWREHFGIERGLHVLDCCDDLRKDLRKSVGFVKKRVDRAKDLVSKFRNARADYAEAVKLEGYGSNSELGGDSDKDSEASA